MTNPLNAIPLDLDITGTNPDNLIQNEPHTLSDRPTRSIAPNFGVIFAKGLIIRDGATLLKRGVDYQLVELHQEATLRYGKELVSVILIINPAVSSNVTITYQALGGHYCASDTSIANMYQSVINDNRPVDWTNLMNKPTEYNPTIHRHLLDDIFGFEPIVDGLERIKRAITLGQTDILLEIINSLLGKFKCGELPLALPSDKMIQYDALLYFLSRRKILSNVWIDTLCCKWYKGDSAVFQVDTSGYPVGTTLYWELYKPKGNVAIFGRKHDSFKTTGGIMDLNIYVPAEALTEEKPLYLGIKEHLTDVDYKAVTYLIDVVEYTATDTFVPSLLVNTEFYKGGTATVAAYHADSDDVSLYHMLKQSEE